MVRRILAAIALLAVLAPMAWAQTADELVTKNIAAKGGLEKLKAINSSRATGRMVAGPGMEFPFTMVNKRPNSTRIEFNVQGMTGIQAYDGKTAWMSMPFMGKKDPEVGSEEDNKNALDDSDFDGALVDYKTKGHTIELVGKEPVEGADAYKLKVTKKNGNIEYDYLDAETYLLVKTAAKRKFRGTEMEGETTLSDYKDVDGLMQPFSMESGAKEMPQKQKFMFSKIEMNVPLEESRFAVPAGATGAAAPAAAATDSSKSAPKEGDAKAAAATDTTKKDAKATKSSGKKKGK